LFESAGLIVKSAIPTQPSPLVSGRAFVKQCFRLKHYGIFYTAKGSETVSKNVAMCLKTVVFQIKMSENCLKNALF